MRTLLEIHYDELHYERYLRKVKAQNGGTRNSRKRRKSDFEVFKSVVVNFKRRLCQRIELPDEVKELLKSQKDETNWSVLEELRSVILLFVQGDRRSTLDTDEERKDLSAAISCATDPNHWNVIGPGVTWVPPGSWLRIDQQQADYINENVRKEERRDFLAQNYF